MKGTQKEGLSEDLEKDAEAQMQAAQLIKT